MFSLLGMWLSFSLTDHLRKPNYIRSWLDPSWIIPTNPTSASCVKITPDVSRSYVQDDPLPEGRTMANLIFLPDGKILCLNGAKLGDAAFYF